MLIHSNLVMMQSIVISRLSRARFGALISCREDLRLPKASHRGKGDAADSLMMFVLYHHFDIPQGEESTRTRNRYGKRDRSQTSRL